MENERSSLITIGGEQYEMVLTTRATKAISTRYGGGLIIVSAKPPCVITNHPLP